MGQLVKTFAYCGGTQSFTMPDGFNSQVQVYMWGGGGGGAARDGGNGFGGDGAAGWYINTLLDIEPGDYVSVTVGGGGYAGTSGSGNGAGYHGGSLVSFSGGNGGNAGPAGWSGAGGGGGGASVIFINNTLELCAAGGGGGGGGSNYVTGNAATGEIRVTDLKTGQDCPGDGGGGGGGGGGLFPGNGGECGFDGRRHASGGYSGLSTDGAQYQAVAPKFPMGQDSGYWVSPTGQGGGGQIDFTANPGVSGLVVLVFTSSASGKVRINNEWKPMQSVSVKVNGNWENVTGTWVKQNGQWRKLVANSPSDIVTTFSAANFG
jgi:hypothetical protein